MLQKDFKGSNSTTGMQNIATMFEMNLLATIVHKRKISSRKNKWHISQPKSHANRAYRKAGYLTMVIAGYIPANSQLAAAIATIVKSLSIGK